MMRAAPVARVAAMDEVRPGPGCVGRPARVLLEHFLSWSVRWPRLRAVAGLISGGRNLRTWVRLTGHGEPNGEPTETDAKRR